MITDPQLRLLACRTCGGPLSRVGGAAHCAPCGAGSPIRNEILCLLDEADLTGEAAFERHRRDQDAQAPCRSDRVLEDRLTLEALGDLADATVLELGCGNGHFTAKLAAVCRLVVAVDFSLESLRAAATALANAPNVLLVQADVTKLSVAPNAFTHALSTLTSNLPTEDDRAAMYRLMRDALPPGGVGVFTAHHYDMSSRLRRAPSESRYAESGIFFKRFTAGGLRREAIRVFDRARVDPVCVRFPGLGRVARMVGDPAKVLTLAARVPVLNQWSQLVLARVER